jgi:hypothetical protein
MKPEKKPVVWTTEEIIAVSSEDIMRAGLELAGKLYDLLYGNHPFVQGIALADALSMWVASHVDADVTARKKLLDDHRELVERLLPQNIKVVKKLKRRMHI